MSFYTYHGKLDSELFVVVLPHGTVEQGDAVYVYTKNKFSSFKANEVFVTKIGEDVIGFHNDFVAYEATSKKGYRELEVSIKAVDGTSHDVRLTRLYDLPLSNASSTDEARIWTGTFDFLQWAKEESIIAILPKGVGKDKPVVCLWQWTKDNKGAAKTVSAFTSKLVVSDKSDTATFSFTQGGYYTLDCKINPATAGLEVVVKSSSNPDTPLKELTAAKIVLGVEHNFNPPRPLQHKVELDCSHPRTAPALPRTNIPLPFPGNLVDTLSYSAAFVDQAGYLAKYAMKQFEQLEKSFQQLEKKSEARGAQIVVLEGEVKDAKQKNAVLSSENGVLKKQIVDNQKLAEKKQGEMQKKIDDTNAALSAARGLIAALKADKTALKADNARLRDLIAADQLADAAREAEFVDREREHAEHDAHDHALLKAAENDLAKSRASEELLREQVQDRDRKVATLTVALEHAQGELEESEKKVDALTEQLDAERAISSDLTTKLADTAHLLSEAQKDNLAAKELIAKHVQTIAANKAAAEKKLAEELAKHEQLVAAKKAEVNLLEQAKDKAIGARDRALLDVQDAREAHALAEKQVDLKIAEIARLEGLLGEQHGRPEVVDPTSKTDAVAVSVRPVVA
ncbi:hypothetical protein ACN47E_007145 [Coniothyrium glycines]